MREAVRQACTASSNAQTFLFRALKSTADTETSDGIILNVHTYQEHGGKHPRAESYTTQLNGCIGDVIMYDTHTKSCTQQLYIV